MITVKVCGTGTEFDAELVRKRLALLPPTVLAHLDDKGICAGACRNNVTDHRPDLADKRPRNWPDGMTWTRVPGCYLPDEEMVLIATIGVDANRRVPVRGEGHGSFDLVVHETMHADDYATRHRRSGNVAFGKAQKKDVVSGGFEKYEYEAAVLEEAYAESAARFFAQDHQLEVEWPALFEFWRNAKLPVTPARRRRGLDVSHENAPVGTVQRISSTCLELDLVARDDKGRIGHALVQLVVSDLSYFSVAQKFKNERRSIKVNQKIVVDRF